VRHERRDAHLRVGRSVLFTDADVAAIDASYHKRPTVTAGAALCGQKTRSARHKPPA